MSILTFNNRSVSSLIYNLIDSFKSDKTLTFKQVLKMMKLMSIWKILVAGRKVTMGGIKKG